MKTSTLIILQVLPEIILDKVHGVTVGVILKWHSNSHCRNIYLSDSVWDITLIHFELLSQLFTYY